MTGWPPGITSLQAYEFHLHDRSTCGCGHAGGWHGTSDAGVGQGRCGVVDCECEEFHRE